jgi:hypothetical protein
MRVIGWFKVSDDADTNLLDHMSPRSVLARRPEHFRQKVEVSSFAEGKDHSTMFAV